MNTLWKILGGEELKEQLSLERVECARNSGIFTLLRILIGSLVFFSLNTIFYLPLEGMLPAIQSLKTNVLFFIAFAGALIPLSFLSLVVGLPLNNVLTSVNKELSLRAAQLRMLESLVFIVGMVLLIAELQVFYQVLLFGLIIYAIQIMIFGYLIFISGYLNRIIGISLIIGGLLGYLFASIAGFLAPSLIWISGIGIAFAIIAEISLALVLVITAKRTTFGDSDSKTRVIRIIKELGEATTTEIIAEASKDSLECRDRVPRTLKVLESNNEVAKRFSKEKKGYVWSLVG